MKIDDVMREGLRELADDIPAGGGLAETAVRRARRRRTRVRVTAAAGFAVTTAVAVPITMDVLSQPDMAAVDVLGPAAPLPAESDPEILPAPSSQQLEQDELVEAFAACRAGVDGEGDAGFDGWEPVFGINVNTSTSQGTPSTWIVARHGDQYRADCALDASGNMVAGGGTYGLKETPALLYALVDGQEGLGVGRNVEPVVQVTVQVEDGPEQEAVMHGGFWFYPPDAAGDQSDESGSRGDQEQQAEGAISDLIRVPAGHTYRGYDAAGDLVFDSAVNGPSLDDCYADPTGSEFVGNHAGHTDPSECVRTHRWQPAS